MPSMETLFSVEEIVYTIPSDNSIRVFESVQAGFPSPGTEENAHDITLDDYLIENPNTTILVKVSGDSMEGAGILEGDMVVVEKDTKGKVGDIVIAEVDGAYTLKFLANDMNGYYLKAGNKKYPPIRPEEELRLFGVVT